jgi:hypothetical protein
MSKRDRTRKVKKSEIERAIAADKATAIKKAQKLLKQREKLAKKDVDVEMKDPAKTKRKKIRVTKHHLRIKALAGKAKGPKMRD